MTAPLKTLTPPNKSYLRSVADLIQQARQGIVRSRVDEIAQLVGLTDKEMAHILNMSVRSLHGKSDAELLTLAASERLLLLERLVQHGLSVFDNRADLLSRWLHTPLNELSYRDLYPETDNAVSSASVREMGSFQEPELIYERTSSSTATVNPAAGVAQSPLAVLDTVSGFSLVEDVLGRIEWGITG